MELVWLELNGYKRFAELSKMHVGGKLVAVVGPNEAGKTSLLRGLFHFNNVNAFVRDGASQEITRGKNLDDEQIVVEFTFAIEDDDRSQLSSEVAEAKNARWFAVRKTVSGKIITEIKDCPKRDLTLRHKLASKLKEVADLNEIFLNDDIAIVLNSEDESLNSRQLSILRNIVNSADQGNDIVRSFATQLSELIAYEERDHPENIAKKILLARCPKVLLFKDQDRDLLPDYDLNSFYKSEQQKIQSLQPIPPALKNLVNTANLDLEELYKAQSRQDRGCIRTILDKANSILSQRIQDTWKQSKLSVNVDLDQWRLTILIKSENGDYVKIAERSDGLRQFVALLMFLSQEPNMSVAPIVLIDEAEKHLHYDAQADLIQMFTRQDAASKIIYTTHSIGCLPEDLGAVRMIAAEEPHSKIINWFWDSDVPGFSTLLFAMGANTLAFILMRYAIIAEGAADMILVPALLKNVLGKDELGFQVAPGLSSVNSEGIAIINNQSPRTAYLVDTDEGGKKIRGQIIAAGVPQERVIDLPSIHGLGTVTAIEDFVDPKSYVKAVNEELKLSYGDNFQVTIADIDGPNVSKLLEIWCKKKKIKAPSKRAVAYRMIEGQYDYQLVRSDAAQQLCELYQSLNKALGLK
ncbi:AAA family ATPase [Anabaena sp. PCC 7108]|uniref:AAA family ATPase n=1 Tax=Anabaena sp. PCC 7108 TaxID=163908 RepID=UPI0003474918|nr:AAA family ATPase [Anabaena sp. PCC 7108]